jgi:rRNA maturation endonuclease Nob1
MDSLKKLRGAVSAQVRRLEREENSKYVARCGNCSITFPPRQQACSVCGERLSPELRKK